ncbi:hypothetical protein LK07_18605 [Streptomyces pluripotens]|uniref:Uncharacterized protein n=1 Tax=Streptomyces pluripotens TaxID=1355015 RepID=A0A221P0X3_9ACTN|nr:MULTISPECIES: hypothetical protein [Streptomyces]ARP71437.1 hypothetical protein LK06_017450 [Streptomyces pluripotens]ASN25688.1 hypothetical protein LK07_18605 [Streptomyces pluripotens]KIE25012.1 hypothetical protein LK08_20935 [Streptomyces sp. MUSC 125]MCH0560165.1 hypothetical protein [Streptomyces sp. MUM 16J]
MSIRSKRIMPVGGTPAALSTAVVFGARSASAAGFPVRTPSYGRHAEGSAGSPGFIAGLATGADGY